MVKIEFSSLLASWEHISVKFDRNSIIVIKNAFENVVCPLPHDFCYLGLPEPVLT